MEYSSLSSNSDSAGECDEDDEMSESIPMFTCSESMEKPITLRRLLQHFAVYTNQTKQSMTYLLQLLKRHQPTPHYDLLPSSGQQLMWIDGSDVVGLEPDPAVNEEIIEDENDKNKSDSVEDLPLPTDDAQGGTKKKKMKRPLKLQTVIELDGGGKFITLD